MQEIRPWLRWVTVPADQADALADEEPESELDLDRDLDLASLEQAIWNPDDFDINGDGASDSSMLTSTTSTLLSSPSPTIQHHSPLESKQQPWSLMPNHVDPNSLLDTDMDFRYDYLPYPSP